VFDLVFVLLVFIRLRCVGMGGPSWQTRRYGTTKAS
jgi:hypothetical protein